MSYSYPILGNEEKKRNHEDWFGLVSLFNGISTFEVYLKPKPSLLKNSSDAIEPIAGRIRRFIPFPRVFVQK